MAEETPPLGYVNNFQTSPGSAPAQTIRDFSERLQRAWLKPLWIISENAESRLAFIVNSCYTDTKNKDKKKHYGDQ